jgi:hypothetical protein
VECGEDEQGYSFRRDRQWFATIAPALRFIEKALVTDAGASVAAYGVRAVSSAAASLLGSINKDTLDSVMSDLCAELSSDIRDGIDAVAERGELPDLCGANSGKEFPHIKRAVEPFDTAEQHYALEEHVETSPGRFQT